MAARSTPLAARRLLSPALKELFSRQAATLGAIGLALLGLAVLVALVSYDPRDPSLNTATPRRPSNLVGQPGAIVADLLLQGFGVAGALPGLALLAWAWRVGSHRGLGSIPLRLAALLGALPVIAALLAAVPRGVVGPSPSLAGYGGAIGAVLATSAQSGAHDIAGIVGVLGLWLIGLMLAILLIGLAFGLSTSEWRFMGRSAGALGRMGLRGGRAAVGAGASAAGGASAWITHLRDRQQGMRGDDEPRLEPQADARGRREPDRQPAPTQTEVDPPWDADPAPVVTNTQTITHRDSQPTPPVTPVSQPPRIHQQTGRSRAQASSQPPLPLPEPGWRFPDLDLLKRPPIPINSGPNEDALQANARLLETVLDDYGVKGAIVEIRPGPVVTLYELEPAPGIRSARVIGLADDVARSLSVTAVRIATVPGRNVIGIEVPNARRETVYLQEILASDELRKSAGKLTLALGKDIGGTTVVADLARMPHLMIAGTTGSGKSVGVNAMILSLLYRLSPDQCRLILIDPKMLELSVYEGIPHLMAPVVTEPAKAVTALKWVVREMERRYRAMSQLNVRNIGGYNDRVAEARAKGEVVTRRVQTGFDPDTGRPTFEDQPLALETLPFIVVVVDEMADLMMVAGKEIEAAVQRLAQMARAAGIHVIMATQRPSVDVITGTIKANFPTRISFQVISKFDSRTILGEQGAEQLLGQGDMLYMAGGGRIQRVHGPFVTDEEVERVVDFLREQGEPAYVEEVTEAVETGNEPALTGISGASDADKTLFDQAVAVIAREGKVSTSFIQRHLGIGYNKAAKLVEQMEKEGIITPANHVGKREILVRRTQDED